MKLHQYLRKQKDRDDPVGDFARDALEDKKFPHTDRPIRVENYLRHIGASSQAIQAWHEACREWRPQEDVATIEERAGLAAWRDRARSTIAGLMAERCKACLRYIDDSNVSSENGDWCDDCWCLNENVGGVRQEEKRYARLISQTIKKSEDLTIDWLGVLDYFAMAGGEARAILETPVPGWFVVESGLDITAGGYLYAIFPKERLKEEDWYPHLSEKVWTSNEDVALALDHARMAHDLPLVPHRGYRRHIDPIATPQREGDFMRKALVQFYEKDGQRAVRTNAGDVNEFLLSAALQLDIVLPDRGDERRVEMLADWLPQITEVAAKLKGYKADVYEERVIIAGRWKPEQDAEVLSAAEVLGEP